MPRINAAGIEGDQHLLLLAVDHHHESAVAGDLCPLGRAWPAAVTNANDEIAIEASGGGVWRGSVMMIGPDRPVLCVRTHVVPTGT